MVKGYGNWDDPPLKPRDDSVDQPHPKQSIGQKILATLPPGKRDTPSNRRRALAEGWTEEEFEEWANGTSTDAGVRDG